MVWLVVTLFVIYGFSLNTAAGVFSNAIKLSLHLSNIQVAFATGSFIFGFAAMQIPAGYLLDTFKARYVVSTAILLLALGNVMISFADSLSIFMLSNFVQGVGASFAFLSSGVLISQWFTKNQFPLFFGFTQAFACIFSGVIHYIVSMGLEKHTWNEIYQIFAIVGFGIFLLSLMFIRNAANQPVVKHSIIGSLKIVLKNKQILLSAVAAATSFGVLLAYAGFWYLDVEKFYAVDDHETVIIGGIIFLGVGFGTPLMAWLSNYYRSRRLVIHSSLALGAMALLVGLYSPHFNVQTLIFSRIVAFMIGFFLSASTLLYTVVSEITSDGTRGVALSIMNTCVFLFNTCLLFVPYWFITDFSKDFFTYLWILPFCIMFSVFILYFIKESYQK